MGGGKDKRRKRIEQKRKGSSSANASPAIGVLRPLEPDQSAMHLRPTPWDGEKLEDLAVFTKTARDQLAAPLQAEAAAVSDSLDLVHAGEFSQAVDGLKMISRGSPFSDWRLLVRGLVAFYQGESAAARDNWSRLDATRRPARIAATLLETENSAPPASQAPPSAPEALVVAAQTLLRRTRTIEAARRIATVKPPDPKTLFSFSQVSMLAEFREEHRRFDAPFVQRFSQACVRRAGYSGTPDHFLALKTKIPGPPEDPRWNLQGFFVAMRYADADEIVENCAKLFLEEDLPKLTQYPESVRDAIASSIHLHHAHYLQAAEPPGAAWFLAFVDMPSDEGVEHQLQMAIERYPANRDAHDELADLYAQQLSRRLDAKEEKTLRRRQFKAMEARVRAFPDDVETTLSLIDSYFEDEKLDKAAALVRRLGSQRLDDPIAKALPWKLRMLEALHASRRKTSLAEVARKLDAAAELWPSWLRRDWLAWLRAALALRRGDREAFERGAEAARRASGVSQSLGEIMQFAALQQMNLPAAELKPFRARIDEIGKSADAMPIEELSAIGDFFWDLARTGLRHKAYRLQAAKFGRAFCQELKAGCRNADNQEQFLNACVWAGEQKFFSLITNYDAPPWLHTLCSIGPKPTAGGLKWLLGNRYTSTQASQYAAQLDMLRAQMRIESDPFYRHLYEKLVQRGDQLIALRDARRTDWGQPNDTPRNNLDFEDDDFGDDFDDGSPDDSPDVDDECQCAACRKKRAQEAATAKRHRPGDRELYDRLDEAGANMLDELLDEIRDATSDSEEDDEDRGRFGDSLPAWRPPPAMTADERRAAQKSRRKTLEQKKKKRR